MHYFQLCETSTPPPCLFMNSLLCNKVDTKDLYNSNNKEVVLLSFTMSTVKAMVVWTRLITVLCCWRTDIPQPEPMTHCQSLMEAIIVECKQPVHLLLLSSTGCWFDSYKFHMCDPTSLACCALTGSLNWRRAWNWLFLVKVIIFITVPNLLKIWQNHKIHGDITETWPNLIWIAKLWF